MVRNMFMQIETMAPPASFLFEMTTLVSAKLSPNSIKIHCITFITMFFSDNINCLFSVPRVTPQTVYILSFVLSSIFHPFNIHKRVGNLMFI